MFTDGYQYAKATVTQFSPQPSLVGTWTPEVARNMFSGKVQLQSSRWGSLGLYATLSGREYDATGNTYELSGYARFDVEASHQIRGAWQAYASVQNLLDRSIQTARTPVLSLGTPQVAVFGIRRHLFTKS
jgi:outer membrane cobalamin receptor